MIRFPPGGTAPKSERLIQMTTHTKKTIVILGIVLAAAAIWVPRQIALVQARRGLDGLRAQQAAVAQQLAADDQALEEAQRKLEAEVNERNRHVAAVARVEHELKEEHPETRWVDPPSQWPEWNPESPYVWIRKEIIPKLPVTAFTDDGSLRPEVGLVMTINPVEMQRLNHTLSDLLRQVRSPGGGQCRTHR